MEYERQWRKLKDKYKAETALLTYLQNTWILWRKRFMAPWINQHLHLGTVVTSRVESAHSVLKRYLEVRSFNYMHMGVSPNIYYRCQPATCLLCIRILLYLFIISMRSMWPRLQSRNRVHHTVSTFHSSLSCMATSLSRLYYESTTNLSDAAGATSP